MGDVLISAVTGSLHIAKAIIRQQIKELAFDRVNQWTRSTGNNVTCSAGIDYGCLASDKHEFGSVVVRVHSTSACLTVVWFRLLLSL